MNHVEVIKTAQIGRRLVEVTMSKVDKLGQVIGKKVTAQGGFKRAKDFDYDVARSAAISTAKMKF